MGLGADRTIIGRKYEQLHVYCLIRFSYVFLEFILY